jgi:hypothetical protein
LTTYANEVTGASDTNLSDAVYSLAEGYGQGGASNVVTGTFKSATVGASVDVDIDYSGTGYPIAMLIFVAEGADNTNGTFYQTTLRGANIFYVIVKNATDVSPTYSGAGATDMANYFSKYKNSATDNTAIYTNGGSTNIYNNANAATNNDRIVRLRSNKKFAVFMCAANGSANGGFAPNVDYRYVIVYSS